MAGNQDQGAGQHLMIGSGLSGINVLSVVSPIFTNKGTPIGLVKTVFLMAGHGTITHRDPFCDLDLFLCPPTRSGGFLY